MLEIDFGHMEIVGEAPKERDFCYMAPPNVGRRLTRILNLERRLSEEKMSSTEWERVMHQHIVEWGKIPDYYKSQLADADNIAA